MKRIEIKNCTPHPIVVRMTGRDEVELDHTYSYDLTIKPCGIIPRVSTIENPASGIDGIPCIYQKMGEVQGLPNLEEGVFLLVSALVFGACDRNDLLAPDTGKTCIRDESGRIVAVTRLIRKGD